MLASIPSPECGRRCNTAHSSRSFCVVIKFSQLCCRCWPSLQETGEFKIKVPGRCRDAILEGGELFYLGRREDRQKSVRSVLDRLSQTLVIRCDPVHQLLGYSVAHCFRESARFFCACAPMRRRITGHDANPCYQSPEHRKPPRQKCRCSFRGGASMCCGYLCFS